MRHRAAKRAADRTCAVFSVTVWGAVGQRDGVGVNLSHDRMAMMMAEPIEPGVLVQLELLAPHAVIPVTAVVVWSTPTSPSRVGVAFIELSADAQRQLEPLLTSAAA